VGDDERRASAVADAIERQFQVLGVKRCEALIQYNCLRVLQNGSRDKQPSAFAVRQLPSSLSNHLHDASGHTVQQIAEPEFTADSFGLIDIRLAKRPSASHQQVEGEWGANDVILVKLGRARYHTPPAVVTETPAVETTGEHQAGSGLAQSRDERS